MVATAQDVGIFLRALNDGSLLNDDEQAIYSSIYEYEHTGWLPGYQSIARYYKDTDTVVVQFVNSTGGDTELTSNIVFDRIVRIVAQVRDHSTRMIGDGFGHTHADVWRSRIHSAITVQPIVFI